MNFALSALIALFSWPVLASDLIQLFHQQETYRWGTFYPALAPGRIKATPFKEAGTPFQLVEITGWPLPVADVTLHFDGSPLEAQVDPKVINQHLDTLLEGRLRPLTFFVLLDGWASEQFIAEISKRSFKSNEQMSIMTLENLSPFSNGPVEELPKGLAARLIQGLEDFEGLIAYRPAPIQYIYRGFDLSAIRSPNMHSWGVFDKQTGECICTTQLFIHSPEAAIVGMVSTAEAWRRRGLATHLLAKALEHALKTCNIRRAMLQATPMAVSMYKKMGFETIGTTSTYEYSLSNDIDSSCALF